MHWLTVVCCFSTTQPHQQIQAHPAIPATYPTKHHPIRLRSNFQIPSKVHPIPDNLTPAFTRLTFDAWCQQHAPLKKKISGCNKNTVVDDLLRPTTMYTTQDKFHDTTSTTHDSEFDRYPFPPQHTITTTTLFLPVLATATRTYVTILLPSTQLRIACILQRRHVRFRYHP